MITNLTDMVALLSRMARASEGLPPPAEPTPAELDAIAAQERSREEERRREEADRLARIPRHDLGGGRHGRSARMLGRLSSGVEADKGKSRHILPEDEYVALCGARPGLRSVGWSDPLEGPATCPRCLARATKITCRAVEPHGSDDLPIRG